MKQKLREKMREMRRALTPAEVTEKSAVIQKRLFSLDAFRNARNVCTFISAFKEPDTAEIIKSLLSEGRGVIVPITHTGTNTLSLSYIENFGDLKTGTFGILEPSVIKSADEKDIDVILVPGLAFDRSGGRMGFGKGYYDRLLKNTGAVKIGLCYDFQLFGTIPTEEHDVPMDLIITEKEIVYREKTDDTCD